MSILDGKLNLKEKQKLENMFAGDQSRDASDKVRGFLFQDLVAINYLLDEKTEYICLEFLEDVDVFCSDGTLKFVQVKYYPKTNPDMKEIMTDLYYQYLRMKILKLDLTTKPQLVIHRNHKISIPDLEKMKMYVKCSKLSKPEPMQEPAKWLTDEVYVLNKKELQKKKLFSQEAYEESICSFLGDFESINVKDIVSYQEEVASKLAEKFPETDMIDDEEDRKKILLGLAIEYVQRRYTLDHPDFEELRVVKSEFIEYIQRIMETQTEEYIIAYVTSIVAEQYISIIRQNPEMKTEHIELLNYIASNTQIWISELAATKEGQYQLINTVSYKDNDKVKGFVGLNIAKRMLKIAECADGFQMFLNYLWKIMLDLCMNKKDFNLKEDADMIKPQSYIDASVKSYICLKFKQDFVGTSVILPAARHGHEKVDQRNICSRMYLEKPQKWYMAGAVCGKKEYSYNAANIRDDNSVIDLDDDSYFIECMDCIKVDIEQWDVVDDCEKCIFVRDCVKRKES